nr:hypothetical protein [Tanacetum cinerariifolium]
VGKVEVAVHPHRGVAGNIICPQVAGKQAVQPPNGAAKRVVVRIQSLRKNRVLNGHVHRRQLVGRARLGVVVHVPVDGHILIQAPARRHVVDADIAHRVAAQAIVAAGHVGSAT